MSIFPVALLAAKSRQDRELNGIAEREHFTKL